MRTLLEAGAHCDHESNIATPLQVATQYGHVDAVQTLLEFGADLDVDGDWCPLHSAASRGHVEGPYPSPRPSQYFRRLTSGTVIETLLEWGTNVEIRGQYNKTALIWAAEIGQAGSVRALLAHDANPNARDAFGETTLHYASANGYLDVVKDLVERGGDVLARNGREMQPIHLATNNERGSKYSIVNYLVGKRVDVNSRDGTGYTALHSAAKMGRTRQARLLLESGADPTIVDGNGESAMHVARANGLEDMIQLLDIFRQRKQI